MFEQIWQSIILGILEGVTEFIPVSSTGHLILAGELLGFENEGQVFEIAIQLGAILAICYKYWPRLFGVASTLHKDKSSQKFAFNIIISFLPAVVIGLLAHGFIKEVLFDPLVVAISLIIGGFIILFIESLNITPKTEDIDEMDWKTALKIGFLQTIAMIPGVSRSGATIMGALTLGVGRKAATEFSFFLAIPTMFGATVYDLYKNSHHLNSDSLLIIAIGFVSAFIAALFVVSKVVDFVEKNGFKPFAYYRIAIGILMLLLLFV